MNPADTLGRVELPSKSRPKSTATLSTARRPALAAALAIVAGIALYPAIRPNPLLFASAAAASAIGALVFSRYAIVASIALAIGFLALGVALAQAEFFRYPLSDISAFASDLPRLAHLELRIDRPPRIITKAGGARPSPPKQMVTATVLRALTRGGWTDCTGSILVQVNQPNPLLTEGQRVRVLGMLGRPAPAMNPGQFDSAAYYREQRILATIQIPHPANVQIISTGGVGPLGWARESARHLLAEGFPARRALDHALLRALVFGDSDPMTRDIQDAFQRLGTAYLLSVSGIHVAVIGAFVFALCRLLMRPPRFSSAACLVTIILYGLLALPSGPIMRSAFVASAMLIGVLSNRSRDKLNLLALAAGAMLCSHPSDLFNAGFQLGFLTILGLVLLGKPALHSLIERDIATAAARKNPLSWSATLRHRAWILLRDWTVLSAIAWAVSTPLVAYGFGTINPWAIVAGVFLFPVVALALIGGCFKILFTLAWPSLASLWARGAVPPISAMRHLADLLARLPGADVPVMRPPIWLILLYYAVLLAPLIHWKRAALSRISRVSAAVAPCCFFAFLVFGAGAGSTSARGELSVTFLDIGAGQCAIIRAPGTPPALLDAGSSTISDVTRSCLGPYLRECGDRRLSTVLLSHSDFDHISAIPGLWPQFGISQVYTSPFFADFARIDPPAQALLDVLGRRGQSPRIVQRGDHLPLGPAADIAVLWPPADCDFDCNNTGLVLRLTFAGRTILFPADIQADAMRELLKTPGQLKADVLVAAHHGSSEANTAAFVRAVDPKVIVSSNAEALTGKQKQFDRIVARRALYRTSSCGAITVHIHKDGTLSVETFRPLSVPVR